MAPHLKDDEHELRLIEDLDALLSLEPIAKEIEKFRHTVRSALVSGESFEHVTVPLEVFQGRLPELYKSVRVFGIRREKEFPRERHLNSHQRVRSLEGEGEMLVYFGNEAQSFRLSSAEGLPLWDKWVSVPKSIWHRIIGRSSIWVGMAFHTTPIDMLIDEHIPA